MNLGIYRTALYQRLQDTLLNNEKIEARKLAFSLSIEKFSTYLSPNCCFEQLNWLKKCGKLDVQSVT